jgi:pimeloyl-CoA dehydrogenase small subunit
MDFDLTDEQRLLQDSVDRLLADAYDFDRRRRYQAESHGFSAALWSRYAELGLLALPFAEADGGFGGGGVEAMIVMNAIGRCLAVEPYLATIVLGGGFLRLGTAEQRARWIPRVADGSLRLAFAHVERQARYDLFDVAATARRDGAAFVLNGSKGVVLHGDSADLLIVSARTGGARRDRDGINLFLVDANAPGLSCRGYPTQDGLRAAEITLENVIVDAEDMIGEPDTALPLIERVVDGALAAVSAEAVGAMDVLQRTTVDYLKSRKQFGVAIGSFQALQHRAADMLIALEQARSMALYAAMLADSSDPPERRTGIAAAKVQVNESVRAISQEAIQLHGGIAMTDACNVGHYVKRLTMIGQFFGDTDHHLRSVADSGGLIASV